MRDYDSLILALRSDLSIGSVDESNAFNSDASIDAVSRYCLASSFYKKLCPEGNSAEADAAAMKKFIAINGSLRRGTFDFEAADEAESCFWDYFRNEVDSVTDQVPFGQSFDLDFIRQHMWVGPGANQLADSTSAVTKVLDGPLSYTHDGLIDLYRAALSGTGIWAEAEMLRFRAHGFRKVDGGKIFFAPKNREISRTCCTEPTLNMMIQKAIGAFLEQGLEHHFGINLSDQPDLNRKLARIGSREYEGFNSFCTIDLVSASDCNALALIDAVIRNPVLKRAIMISRCERVVLPDGSKHELSMVSTMGNGFTFPLMTMLFACAVKACYQVMGVPLTLRGVNNFAVFGDDIIVRQPAYEFLIRMLVKLGYTVNVRKSYGSGPFRESCGHDYFKGSNVRGVYVKTLETPQEVVSVINRLNRWSAHTGIELPATIAILMKWAPKVLVPPSESDDAGIHVPFKLTKPKLTSSYWFKYRCFRRVSAKVNVHESGESSPSCERSTDDSSEPVVSIGSLIDGQLAFGFLSGTYRRREFVYETETNLNPWVDDWPISITLRDKIGARARYKVVTKSIPYWDYLPMPKLTEDPGSDGPWRLGGDPESYDRWEAVVARGLGR